MTYIGNKVINIPKNISYTYENNLLTFTGPLGTLDLKIHNSIKLNINNNQITLETNKKNKAMKGLFRSLINNNKIGVSRGFQKKLILIGTGFKASIEKNVLHLKLGYSHTVTYPIPDNVDIKCLKENSISIFGINNQIVNKVASEIRSLKKPDAYKGKGIRYADEVIILKKNDKL